MENNLKKYRNLKGFTLKALADLVGTTPSQISKLEKGIVGLTAEWCVRIAPHLHIQPGSLMPLMDPKDVQGAILDLPTLAQPGPMPRKVLEEIIKLAMANKPDHWDCSDVAALASKVYWDLYGDPDLTVDLVKGYMKRMSRE